MEQSGLAGHEDMADPFWLLERIFVSGAIGNGLRVKKGQVRHIARLHQAAVRQADIACRKACDAVYSGF